METEQRIASAAEGPSLIANARALADELKAEARRLGFDAVGIAPAVAPPGHPRFLEWLRAGKAAGMSYLHRHAEPRAHPDRLLDGVRSIVIACMSYKGTDAPPLGPSQGRIARYAQGQDYHVLLWRRLEELLRWLIEREPAARGRAVADTAPLPERDFARLAGLGWIGKNTMLINKRLGSYTLLGALLLDIELPADKPHEANHCGSCTRCLDACPTQAFDEPGSLDARKCLSYWTIEHRGPIAEEYADRLDGWVFGCDVCQDVCPWNRKAPDGANPELQPREEWINPDLWEWLRDEIPPFAANLKGSAMSRAKRPGLLRNAALILGARRDFQALPILEERLKDSDPLVRESAEWAIRRIRGADASDSEIDNRSDSADPFSSAGLAAHVQPADRDKGRL